VKRGNICLPEGLRTQECTLIAVTPYFPLDLDRLAAHIKDQFELPCRLEQSGEQIIVCFPVGLRARGLDNPEGGQKPINAKWVFEMLVHIERDIIGVQEAQARVDTLLALPMKATDG
jgi:hypothetical protein